MNSVDEDLPSAPAALRNRQPILEVLQEVLGESGTLLEIASGLGDHAAHFARALPNWTVAPSDLEEEHLTVIRERVRRSALSNLLEPVTLDVTRQAWPVERVDAVFCANMIHISPWQATEGLFQGAARILPAKALLVTYGPYAIDGEHTAPSNAEFDASLRRRDPRWGVRDLRDVEKVAGAAGFRLERRVAMPANNLCLVWRLEVPKDPTTAQLLGMNSENVSTNSLRFVGRG